MPRSGFSNQADTIRLPDLGSGPITPRANSPVLGSYTNAEFIGAGGMGVVYKATSPDGRTVAVKVIPAGATDQSVSSRLEREWKTLANLDHPNVAHVFESGSTHDGRPYFAMEYIPGIPLVKYADQHQLSIRQRLELFRGVAAGVSHLHRQGIIHRDLKPGNILVCEVDGQAVPKLIDFGLAKLIGSASGMTSAHGYVGTPHYMAPEQAAGNGVAADTRADVYSLGVILYELMTGTLPLTTAENPDIGVLELLIRLQVKDPPPPSTRVVGTEVTELASRRCTDPASLRMALSGDMDRVILKALDRNRELRYGTVEELSADVQRYLNDEPVSVSSPGMVRQLLRFIRRNKTTVAAVVCAFLSLLAVAASTTYGLVRARTAEKLAKERLEETKLAKALTEQTLKESQVARFLAQAELERQQQDAEGLRDDWYHVSSGGGTPAPGVKAAVLALGKTADDPGLHPAIRLRMVAYVADTLVNLGDPVAATPYAQRSYLENKLKYGDQHPETRTAARKLANYLSRVNRHSESIPLYELALPPMNRAEIREPIKTLTERMNLAMCYQTVGRESDARNLYQLIVDRGRVWYGVDHPTVLSSMLSLSVLIVEKSPAQAVELALLCQPYANTRPLVQFPTRDHALQTLIWVYMQSSRPDLALPLSQEMLAEFEKVRPRHWRTAFLRSELGYCLSMLKDYQAAECYLFPAYEELILKADQLEPQDIGYLISVKGRALELYQHLERPDVVESLESIPIPRLREKAPRPHLAISLSGS